MRKQQKIINVRGLLVGIINVKSLGTTELWYSAKSGNISHILKAFFVRHSSEYETSDNDRNVIQNLYSQTWLHMVR